MVFEIGTKLWITEAQNTGRWYWGVLDETEWFMFKFNEDGAKLRKQHRAPVTRGAQGKRGRGGARNGKRNPTNEMEADGAIGR